MRVLTVLLSAFFLAAAACTPAVPELLEGRRDVPGPRLWGRSFDVIVLDGEGQPTRTRTVVGGDGPDLFEEVFGAIMDACQIAVGVETRFDVEYQPDGAQAPPDCGIGAARLQQRFLCAAHYLATFSQAVTPVDVFGDFQSQAPAYVIHVRQSGETDPLGPNGPGGGLPHLYTIPVQDSSGKATLALWSTVLFQGSALTGAYALDPDTCPDTTLFGTVPAARDRGTQTGWSDERVPLGLVVAMATAEASEQMLALAEDAEQAILASSAQKVTTDWDRGRATIEQWRGLHDSRLEIANMYVGAPLRLFEKPDDPEVISAMNVLEGGEGSGAAGELVVCAGGERPPSEIRAEGVIRSTQVDVRATDEQIDAGVIETRLRFALAEDFPFTFSDTGSMSDADFLGTLGISQEDVRSAARRVFAEASALGRVIVDDPVRLGRVVGTTRASRGVDPAILYAATAGEGAVDHGDDPAHRPTSDYGGLPTSGGETLDFLGYAMGSIFGTADTVATAVGKSAVREDLRKWVTGPATYDKAGIILGQLRTMFRTVVPHRMQACIGQPAVSGSTTGVDRVRIRLYGTGPSAAPYELWWGEAGLQCALYGNIEGIGCDPDQLRVATIATVGSAPDAGFGDHYVEWDFDHTDIPILASVGVLPDDGRVYVTRRRDLADLSSRRIGLAGTALHPGTGAGDFSRCAYLPAGFDIGDKLASVMGPSPETCSAPQDTCAGLPRDLRLPLEDELTEAGEGRDDIESSFYHYLRLAKEASSEADRLGEEMVRQGLEMDFRAEGAAEELMRICGGVVNVTTLPGVSTAAACTVRGDCPEHFDCVHARCQPDSIEAFVPASGGELAALRACLGIGAAGKLETVILSSHDYCAFRRNDGTGLCDYDGLPTGPGGLDWVACPALGSCAAANGYDEVAMQTGYSLEPLIPLGLVGSTHGGAEQTNCNALLQLITRQPDLDVSTVTSQRWNSHDVALRAAQGMSWQEEPAGFATVKLGDSPWWSTGSFLGGARTSGWPCTSLLTAEQEAEFCGMGVPHRPLSCGMDCTTPSFQARTDVRWRMRRALEALRALSSVDPAGWYLPPWGVANLSGTLDDYARVVGSVPPNSLVDDEDICAVVGAGHGCLTDSQILTFYYAEADRLPEYCIAAAALDDGPFDALGVEPGAWLFGACGTRHRWSSHPVLGPGAAPDSARALYWFPGGQIDQRLTTWYSEPVTPLQGTGLDPASYGSLLDALELACLAQNTSGGCNASLETLPEINSLADVDRLAEQLNCAGQQIERVAERLTLSDVPGAIAAQLRTGSIEPTYPAFQGEYGTTVGELRGVLEELPRALRTIGSTLRDFAGRIELARSMMRVEDLETEIDTWNTMAEVANQAARCVSASSDISPRGAGAAVAVCAASVASIIAAVQTSVLRGAIRDEGRRQAFIGMAMDFAERMDALAEAEANLKTGYSRANALLARLDSLRSQARRAAAKTMMLENEELGVEYPVSSAMRARMSTTRIRYERARRNAIRLSWLARRGIEQRLGVDMSDMWDDMSLVPPPATWADGVCSMPAIDYARIRGELPGGIEDYADSFVGDYVRLLENFIESYRLDFPFTDAGDVAVISLRDDVLHVRDTCSVEGWNQLLYSDDLDAAGWSIECADGERCPLVAELTEQTPFVTRDETSLGLEQRRRHLGGGATFRVDAVCPDDLVSGTDCTAPPSGAVAQDVSLAPGSYLVTWYEPLAATLEGPYVESCSDPSCFAACMGDPSCERGCADPECLRSKCVTATTAEVPRIAVMASETATDTPITPSLAPDFIAPTGDLWLDACAYRRVLTRLEIAGPAEGEEGEDVGVTLAFGPVIGPLDTSLVVSAVLAGPQLERVPAELAHLATVEPLAYFPTTATREREVGLCEDTDGSEFRSATYWTRGCHYLCPDGFGDTCIAGADPDWERAVERCYWETQFALTIGGIERGELLPTGGFALGNFNYRHGGFAANLIGTGVRDCSTAELPSACYASGYVPFSLVHDPPYTVRNHLGSRYQAPLFVGRVEHAKALAAERYLTNPLSSADRALLADYLRTELEGRPLAGNYTLRIYDTPGLSWHKLEDVQLVLNYKYWTRFE